MDGPFFGLGLLSIGRPWGISQVPPPSEKAASELILAARGNKIQFFDTAPAYGCSERILGEVISSHPELFENAIIATKAGEHWVTDTNSTYVDHSYDAMCRSIDRSIELLGQIDILQIHKASEDILADPKLGDVIKYARSCGIRTFGASVSSHEAAVIATEMGLFEWLQFPLSSSHDDFSATLGALESHGVKAIINRPFAMGELAQAGEPGRVAAFKHIFEAGLPKGSVVLSGTSSQTHLLENINSFESALNELDRLWYSGRDITRRL